MHGLQNSYGIEIAAATSRVKVEEAKTMADHDFRRQIN